MAVQLVGQTQILWEPSGIITPAWPAGTLARHLVLAWSDWPVKRNGDWGPRQTGWHAAASNLFWRMLDADVYAAGPGTWDGRLFAMCTVSGARSVGRMAYDRGVKLSEPGSGMLVQGWTGNYEPNGLVYPPDGRLGNDLQIINDQWVAWWFRTYATAGTKQIERDGDAQGYHAYEIQPAKAPYAPVITAPVAGAHLNVADGLMVAWQHQSVSGLPQEARKVRVKAIASPTWQHVTAGGTLNAAEQPVTTSSEVAAVNAGLLPVGTYEVQVATSESGAWSAWSASTQFVLEVGPALTAVTLTSTPGDLTPVGSWTALTPAGAQTAWQAAIVPAGRGLADALLDSLVQPGTATHWSIPALGWVRGGSYVLMVRVQQTGGLWTPWVASAPAVITWTPPAAPGVLTVADGTPLTVQVSEIPATSLAVDVEWAPADDEDWQMLAQVDAPIDHASVPVPIAPYGVARRYRVRSWDTVDGVRVPSDWIISPPTVCTDQGGYLVDASDVTNFLPVCIQSRGTLKLVQGRTVSYGLQSASGDEVWRPLVDETPPAGLSGTMTLLTRSEEDLQMVVAWVTRMGSWLTRWSPEETPDRVMHDQAATLMTLADETSWKHVVARRLAARLIDIPWVEQ